MEVICCIMFFTQLFFFCSFIIFCKGCIPFCTWVLLMQSNPLLYQWAWSHWCALVLLSILCVGWEIDVCQFCLLFCNFILKLYELYFLWVVNWRLFDDKKFLLCACMLGFVAGHVYLSCNRNIWTFITELDPWICEGVSPFEKSSGRKGDILVSFMLLSNWDDMVLYISCSIKSWCYIYLKN